MITIENITKVYEDSKVLDGISFKVEEGEFVCILGPSGCGKTTLLRCISGLDINYSGCINIEQELQSDYLRNKRISVVLQKYSNFPWLNVIENVQTAFSNRNKQVRVEEQNNLIDDILTDLEIIDTKHKHINQLSGGMQQRVAIARALAQNTEIMALDEPFGALDFKTRTALQMIFKKINHKYNRTIVFVTHDVEEALILSDNIFVMSNVPAKIIKTIQPDFKKLQNSEIKYSNEFIRQKKEVEEILLNV